MDFDPTKIAQITGCYIAELRKDKGLTQSDLSEIIHMSLSNVSHYEQGLYAPPVHTLVAISEYFKVSCDYILGRTRFRASYSKLNEKYAEDQTVGDILNKLLALPTKHRKYIIQTLSILEKSDN